MSLTVAAFYQFTRFPEPASLQGPLAQAACGAGVKGTILLAPEGINGTIAGSRSGIDVVLAHIRTLPGCAALDWKESAATEQPFRRLKIRLKREIVSLGVPGVDPNTRVGTHIAATQWNAVLADPDTVVIDTRNDYETAIGSFKGAIDPGTTSFGAFPEWWAQNRDRFNGKRVAMFCTGGIRCEKASSYLLGQGVPEVLHLKGGILKYLEEVPPDQSRWQGECFVFDDRVAVGHGLTPGAHTLCHACGRPVGPQDHTHPDYAQGISCPACITEYTPADRTRFAERQRQIELARARGRQHIGPEAGE
ncbi:MAG TPA: rhodanese-related sulfurtransferase [Thermohalobaculum sp.]|nr:rhodanese-related sulfurtransferase [Thermohalobaculum sp.]